MVCFNQSIMKMKSENNRFRFFCQNKPINIADELFTNKWITRPHESVFAELTIQPVAIDGLHKS